jgi:hypothetical protein
MGRNISDIRWLRGSRDHFPENFNHGAGDSKSQPITGRALLHSPCQGVMFPGPDVRQTM